jgi:hypothetical protein
MLQLKLKRSLSKRQLLAFIVLGFLVVAAQLPLTHAQVVPQGYKTDETLQRGMLVMLKEGDTSKITALTPGNSDKMLGVVVDRNDTPVSISDGSQTVYVANTGHFDVLVSDQNGAISPNENIAVSALSGIGMKASTASPNIAGKALEGFSGKENTIGTTKVKDSGGQEKEVHLGFVMTDISIGKNPQFKTEAQVPEALRKASTAIANKQVSASKIYVGMVLIFLTSIIAAIVLYSGVRSSMIALGRNPLSRKSILRGMFQVIITSIIIFICGLFGVYLLLKL